MLAGGTGLAPFLAMLEKIAPRTGGNAQPIHLIYGVNTDRDIVERDKLECFSARIPNFSYAVCVVDANSEQPRKGYVTHHIEPAHLNDGDVDIYLCGPPPMVEAVAQHLRDVRREVGVVPLREICAQHQLSALRYRRQPSTADRFEWDDRYLVGHADDRCDAPRVSQL